MDLTNLRKRLKIEIRELGAFTSTLSQDRLDGAILTAIEDIYNERPNHYFVTSATLSTSIGTKGPYDPPANFKGWAPELRNNRLYWYDLQESYVIRDQEDKAWEISYDMMQKKFYFRSDPGTNDLTYYYFPSFDTDIDNIATTISGLPEELFSIVKAWAASDILTNSDNQKSEYLRKKGELLLKKYFDSYDLRFTLPRTRAPIGLNGQRLDGFFESGSILPGYLRGRTPRG
jgi:hypothetical protein